MPQGDFVHERLGAQRALAQKLLQGGRLNQVAPTFLSAVGRLLHWDAGAIWEVTSPDDPLRFVVGWGDEEGRFDELWEASRELQLTRGLGLPGRAWETGEIAWIPSLEVDENFPRRPVAKALGLACGVAIPIPVTRRGGALAISEFFAESFDPPDAELLDLLSDFSAQMAMFIARARAEARIREDEALKSAMLDASLDCIVGMDHRGRIIEFNRAAERVFGYARGEALGGDLAQLLIPPALRQRHRDGLRRYLETAEGTLLDRRMDLTAQRKDLSQFPVELTVTRVPGSDPPLFTGFIRDVSERSQVDQVRSQLAAVIQSTQDAVYSKDLEGRITSWNPGAERMYGYRASEAIGQPLSILIPDDHRNEEMRILERIKRGERVETYETERLQKDGTRIDVSLTVSPLDVPGQGIIGASAVARDVTIAKRRRDAQAFLAKASSELDRSLDPIGAARAIAETAVPELSELCVIDLCRPDGLIGGSVVVATDPAMARELEAIRERNPLDLEGDHPVAQALRAERPLVFRDLTSPEIAQSDEHQAFIRKAGYRSAAVVPMMARGRHLGALSFLHVESDRRYSEDDLELLADLGRRAAVVLDNAYLYSERDRVARTLQRALRPEQPAAIPGVETAVVFEAAGEGIEVGGDFFDIFETPDGWLVLVGDVAGKGSEAASFTVQIRHSVRALTIGPWQPDAVLKQANELLLQGGPGERFATAVLAKLVPNGDALQLGLSVAGHPPAVLTGDDGSRLLGEGPLLGVWGDSSFELEEENLEPRGTLLLYTDGLLEAGEVAEHMSVEELKARVAGQPGRPATATAEELRADALRRSHGHLKDDLVIVALRAKPV
jgi:PAS domain S-box-containing protein